MSGTPSADSISISTDATQLFVVLNGSTTSYALASVDQLSIVGGSGDDLIELRSPRTVPVSIDGGEGSDQIIVGGGNWKTNLLADIFIRGGQDADSVIIDDTLASSAAIAVTNPFNIDTRFATEGAGTIIIDAGTPDSSVEQVELRTGIDADEIDVAGLSALTSLRVLAGGGDDAVLVGNDFDSNIGGRLAVNGGPGENLLLIDDSADTFSDTYLLGFAAEPTFGKDSTASVMTYSNFSTLQLVAGGAGSFPNAQAFRITYLPAGLNLIVDAGTGDDSLSVGSASTQLSAVAGTINFNGQAGFDRLDLYDPIGTTPSTYTVRSDSLAISGRAPVNFTSLQFLNVRANSGNNLMEVLETTAPTGVTLDGGAGNDTFRVGNGDLDTNLGNGVSVTGGSGVDTLILDDSLDDQGNDTYTFSVGLVNRAQRGILWSSSGAGLTESVELLGSANSDTVRISAASSAVRLRINAGDGNDTLLADATSDGQGGSVATVTIVSGEGNDSLSVNSDFVGTDAIVAVDALEESLAQLSIRSGGKLVLAGSQDGTLRVVGSITVSGTLDVNDQTLLVSNGSYTQINTLVTAGYNGGAWSTAVQPAIVSTAASLSALPDALALVRADALNLPVFGTVATLPGDLIVRYTLAADANLDRAVTFDDLLLVAQFYDPAVGNRSWDQGNFNYSSPDTVAGAVGFDDLLTVAQNYGASLTGRRKPR